MQKYPREKEDKLAHIVTSLNSSYLRSAIEINAVEITPHGNVNLFFKLRCLSKSREVSADNIVAAIRIYWTIMGIPT